MKRSKLTAQLFLHAKRKQDLEGLGRSGDGHGWSQYWRDQSGSHVSSHLGCYIVLTIVLSEGKRPRIPKPVCVADFSVKESGFGKEGGSENILDYCVIKTVIIGGGE
jgi:hypothetical protein